ncbi:hypothetical protein [Thioclava sp. L04-15]|uniref:hypothetical protein n=1 Tax=Thioclava sp. L04-15 TaxID=1915318 RepID=UPI0011BA8D64|nr:hypothetical protein [Thioclava sp. L04-15]TNE93229.1 MAG: hypothetical protein EP337_04080 [Paracoccaceae bacterium]
MPFYVSRMPRIMTASWPAARALESTSPARSPSPFSVWRLAPISLSYATESLHGFGAEAGQRVAVA